MSESKISVLLKTPLFSSDVWSSVTQTWRGYLFFWDSFLIKGVQHLMKMLLSYSFSTRVHMAGSQCGELSRCLTLVSGFENVPAPALSRWLLPHKGASSSCACLRQSCSNLRWKSLSHRPRFFCGSSYMDHHPQLCVQQKSLCVSSRAWQSADRKFAECLFTCKILLFFKH